MSTESIISSYDFIKVIPAGPEGIQVLVHGYYPILSLGHAIAVIARMDSLENSISDAMTGLNNKGQLLQEMKPADFTSKREYGTVSVYDGFESI